MKSVILAITLIFGSAKCFPSTQKPLLSQETIKHAADFAVNQINKERGYSCCTYRYVVSQVTDSHSQLTSSGMMLNMNINMGESFCTNNDLNKDRTGDTCPLQPGLAPKTCHFSMAVDGDSGFTIARHTCGEVSPTATPRTYIGK